MQCPCAALQCIAGNWSKYPERAVYRANITVLRNTNSCSGCFEFCLCKIFCDSTQGREEIFHFCEFFLQNSVLWTCFWLTASKFLIFAFFFAFGLLLGGGGGMLHSFWRH